MSAARRWSVANIGNWKGFGSSLMRKLRTMLTASISFAATNVSRSRYSARPASWPIGSARSVDTERLRKIACGQCRNKRKIELAAATKFPVPRMGNTRALMTPTTTSPPPQPANHAVDDDGNFGRLGRGVGRGRRHGLQAGKGTSNPLIVGPTMVRVGGGRTRRGGAASPPMRPAGGEGGVKSKGEREAGGAALCDDAGRRQDPARRQKCGRPRRWRRGRSSSGRSSPRGHQVARKKSVLAQTNRKGCVQTSRARGIEALSVRSIA